MSKNNYSRMVSQRIIGVVIIYEDLCVQSIGFNRFLPVGKPEIAVEYLNRYGIDEIVLLDITPSKKGKATNFSLIRNACSYANTPIAAGGGINSVDDVKKIIASGADKVVFNSACYLNPNVVKEAAKLFGSQAVVASIDVRNKKSGVFEIYINGGSKRININLKEMIRNVSDLGVGEIFINSIDRDGSKKGFDLDLIEILNTSSDLPTIICGGAGSFEDFLEPRMKDLSGIAAANIFHFTEHSAIVLKRYLKENRDDIRLETYANYKQHQFGVDKRLTALDESFLEEIRFKPIIEEII